MKMAFWHKKWLKRVLIAIIPVAAISGILYHFLHNEDDGSAAINTATVEKGDVSVTLTGSGTLEALDMYEVISLVEGEIISATYKEGDEINKGDVLFKIDSSDAETSIKKAELSLEKSRMSYNNTLDTLGDLKSKSSINGTISAINVKVGDEVKSGDELASIDDDSELKVSLYFNPTAAAKLKVGDTAQLLPENTYTYVSGTVKSISSGTVVEQGYANMKEVIVVLDNPGAVPEDTELIGASVADVPAFLYGVISYAGHDTLTAAASGTVEKINFNVGDKVTAKDTIIVISSEDAEQEEKTSRLSLEESELSLDNTYSELDDYNITSPISGTIIEMDAKAGDVIEKDSSSSNSTLAVVADMSKLLFTLDVDELDISNVEEGQQVEITADALPSQTFYGTVTNISIIGTSADGVTTYPVEVEIPYEDGLLPGMNVNASITVAEATDCLRIPISALYRNNLVAVQKTSLTDANTTLDDSSGMLAQDLPEGFVYVKVETGLTNDDYIEVTSGLAEGNVVLLQSTSADTTTTMQQQPMMGGMNGGGPPDGGGGPSGGGSGGGR